MFKNLFQALFGSFFRRKTLTDTELALVKRMIAEAQAIADGSYITDSKLPPPQIPERRKNPR
jgi:hypothetical protein